MMSWSRRGLTILELGVALVVVVIIVMVLLPAMLPARGHHHSGQARDSINIRGIHQGMLLWAKDNKDRYPVPSEIDAGNTTIALAEGEAPETKNTVANIASVLIYNGFFSPEQCVSRAEVNPNIRTFATYQYADPAGTPDPKKALWDPTFSADFTSKQGSGFSYGMSRPVGAHAATWINTFQSTEAILGNRGPKIASVDGKGGATFAIKNSNTLLIHGGKNTWEGNIAYNDNHVNFEVAVAPETSWYHDAHEQAHPDVLFYDEPDDAKGTNNYLTIWTKAGPKATDYLEIWD